MKIFVGGVSASGKTTILKKISEILDYKVIHSTSRLMSYLGFPNDYDKLRSTPKEIKDKAIVSVIKKICEEENNFLLDSHFLTLIKGNIHVQPIERFKDFDALILISVPLDILQKRIELDSKLRNRDLFPKGCSKEEEIKILSDYQTKTEEVFNHVKELYKLPSIKIENSEDNIDEVIKLLKNFVSELKK